MSKRIQYTVEWTIKEGALESFKKLAQEATDLVKANEPGMMGYQWYFNADQSKCYTAEWHSDSESMLAHLNNVGEILPRFFEHSSITRFEVFGDLTPDAEKAVDSLGAHKYGYHTGFTR